MLECPFNFVCFYEAKFRLRWVNELKLFLLKGVIESMDIRFYISTQISITANCIPLLQSGL